MKDIAEKANVSLSTVSFCLNNNGRVSPETRKKVLRIARELNYVPNLAARELAGKSSSTIGVVLPDCRDLKNAPLLEGIERESEVNDYFNLICFTHNKSRRERAYIQMLKGKNVMGLVIFPFVGKDVSANAKLLNQMLEKEVPVVFVDSYLQEVDCSYVVTDNYRAAYEGTEYLIGNGHKEIAYIGGVFHNAGEERWQGYKDAMVGAGIFNKKNVFKDCEFDDNVDKIEKNIYPLLTKKEVTAILAYNYKSTLAAIHMVDYFKEYNKEPEIIGFDFLRSTQIYDFPLYTFCQPHYEMGRKAVNIILDKVKGNEIKDKICLKATLQPVNLVARNRLAQNNMV